jgi:hypothetical protein
LTELRAWADNPANPFVSDGRDGIRELFRRYCVTFISKWRGIFLAKLTRRHPDTVEDPVHRRPRDVEQFGQLDDGVLARLVQLNQVRLLPGGQFGLSAEFALGFGDSHALAGAHTQQVDLELGEGGQDVEEHLAHRVGRS